MTIFDKYKAIQKIGTVIQVPYHVWTLFGDKQRTIEIYGSEICLGEDTADLCKTRIAIEYYVTQFGGKVKWDK